MNNNTEKRAHRPLALTAILLLAVISGSCADPTKATPAKTEVTLEPGIFKVEHPELFRLVKIEERNLPLELNSNGAVAPDLNRTIHVSSMGSGRAVELKVRLGDYVQKGQELLVISSADLEARLEIIRRPVRMKSSPGKRWHARGTCTRTAHCRKKICKSRKIARTKPRWTCKPLSKRFFSWVETLSIPER